MPTSPQSNPSLLISATNPEVEPTAPATPEAIGAPVKPRASPVKSPANPPISNQSAAVKSPILS